MFCATCSRPVERAIDDPVTCPVCSSPLVPAAGNLSGELETRHRLVASATVLELRGDVDVYTAPNLREKLQALESETVGDLLVDLGEVGFLDSAGLGVLVGGLRRRRNGDNKLKIVFTKEPILMIFRVTGFIETFDIYPSVAEATAGAAVADRKDEGL